MIPLRASVERSKVRIFVLSISVFLISPYRIRNNSNVNREEINNIDMKYNNNNWAIPHLTSKQNAIQLPSLIKSMI